MIQRRSLLTGLAALIAAPAVVRAESLMPVRAPKLIVPEPLIVTAARWWRVTAIRTSTGEITFSEAEPAGDGEEPTPHVDADAFAQAGLRIGDFVLPR